MQSLPIITIPDPILRQRAKKVTLFDDNLKTLAQQMSMTMRNYDGVGLAAPQVGQSIRMIVVEYEPRENEDSRGNPFPLTVLVNPTITKFSKEQEVIAEGCLSLPDLEADVKRSAEVNVAAQDLDGKKFKIRAKGLLARALQHEIDHLDGVLFTDRVKNYKDLSLYRPLRGVFLGTPEFAVQALDALITHGFNSFTAAPSINPLGHSTITRSPALSPALIIDSSFPLLLTVTARRSALPLCTTITTSLPSFCWMALAGTIISVPVGAVWALAASVSRNATFTLISGKMRLSSLSNPTRTFTVDFWRSAVGIIAMTLQGIFQSW
jgi:peptide deformylase